MIPVVVSFSLVLRSGAVLIVAIANAYAALEAGATHVDTSVVCPLVTLVTIANPYSLVSENETVLHPLVV